MLKCFLHIERILQLVIRNALSLNNHEILLQLYEAVDDILKLQSAEFRALLERH